MLGSSRLVKVLIAKYENASVSILRLVGNNCRPVSAVVVSRRPSNKTKRQATIGPDCYTPTGGNCSWYRYCLEASIPCQGTPDDYAITYAEKYCNLFNSNYNRFSSEGKQWVDAVRKCLQVKLVPLLIAGSPCTDKVNSVRFACDVLSVPRWWGAGTVRSSIGRHQNHQRYRPRCHGLSFLGIFKSRAEGRR
ncbi:uncharacterized protein LOC112560222 [Pomacea canaliculata]|uniref:uncharacterized protein LOC112560222 n=1 Tax=Pomacea canaliculata TaxID=400727 RepID=UPI000D72F7DF|nr:uncharacterized protein LOC112560222 [Pomacea canaliculata]